MDNTILEMRNIGKAFGGIHALNHVNLSVKKGEIHALCGENGAGKSTLMKILSGNYKYGDFEGEILIDGKEKQFHSVRDSEAEGISIIYQELSLIHKLDIQENIFMGNLPNKYGIINYHKLYQDTVQVLKKVGLDISPRTKVGALGIGKQQLIEIAKALSREVKILILDEPTAALTEEETKILMDILRQLKENGVSCIYISHKLNEVFQISDRITVLRDGNCIKTVATAQSSEREIISLMVGRELNELFPRKEHQATKTILEVKNWTVEDDENSGSYLVKDVSFQIKQGEILGIAGLMGAGRTELVNSIFGMHMGKKSGTLVLEGHEIKINKPADAIQAGIGLVSEERRRYGLVFTMNIDENITLANLPGISRRGILNTNLELQQTLKSIGDLSIKVPSIQAKVGNLSGGNQQKVVLAKWLFMDPKILILDEPTRGIDVGAKFDIYNILNDLVEQGICIVIVSSELQEILGICDRILVMNQGRIVGETNFKEATQESIMTYATGGKK